MNTIPSAVRTLLEELTTDTTQDRAERIGAILAQYPEPKPAPVITADTPVDYSNDAIREHAEHLARNEVYYCVSSLVDSLAKQVFSTGFEGVDEDDVSSITQQDDWETPAREYIAAMDESDDLNESADYVDVSFGEHAIEFEAMREALIKGLEENGKWQEFCYYQSIDPETVEALEHWIVSDWLAGQLESEGEMIARDFLGLTIWGRCTSGQAIAMDHVMLTIARDALAR
jgi:hypothetical protein